MGQYLHNPDGLFYEKRYVVLLKTTACFIGNDVSFLGSVSVEFCQYERVEERAV